MRQTLLQGLVTVMMVQRLRFGRTPATAFQVTSSSFPKSLDLNHGVGSSGPGRDLC
jgi:hypothetical protein